MMNTKVLKQVSRQIMSFAAAAVQAIRAEGRTQSVSSQLVPVQGKYS